MSLSPSMLVLWDIDGTLVDVKGAGRRSFIHGIERAWGIVDDIADVKFGGATDLGVLAQLRRRLHLPEEHNAAFFAHMTAHLEASLAPRTGTAADALPDAARCVDMLHRRGDVVQGLVTGNARSTAYVKLRAAGIATEPFVVGGFGDEHPDRNELARRALARARERARGPGGHGGHGAHGAHGERGGHGVPGAHGVPGTHGSHGVHERVALIGDTPRDVEAAKTIGALAIAILRREEDRAALQDARADHIVTTLREATALVEAACGAPR